MQGNLDFPFIVSNLLRMSQLKAGIHMLEKRCFSLYIILSMILQLSGVGDLITGISTAVAEGGNGKFVFWYQRRNNEVSAID
jgi:hypothetical protein